MHPRISELVHYLDEQAAALRAAFEAVPPQKRGARPSPDRWSPAEIVHHVAIVHRRMAQRIGELVEQARGLPPDVHTSSVVKNSVALGVADRSTPRVASEASQPRDTDVPRVWEEFDSAHHALKHVLASGDGRGLGAVTSVHPVLGDLNTYDWTVFAGAHAARHAAQIREMNAAR